ncbi:hypothetical protein SAMN04488527_11510 [Aliiroseovarius crassostreae]|uniref:hypothetical protein n=1 Tax=Aliiroseovarius crassostreae TaxID=154981 RepID=UPI0008E21A7E|nr:hypothetical protein SAMN04488527_11510 [Aliiroseovarius crassostreae]
MKTGFTYEQIIQTLKEQETGERKVVAHLVEVHQVSQRRACSALNVDRSTGRYQSCRAHDGELRDAMKAVAKERRRFGYRRLQVMIERQGRPSEPQEVSADLSRGEASAAPQG